MQLGEVSIDITISEFSVDRAIEKLRNKIRNIEDIHIVATTDERQLVSLNRHLDIKKRDLITVRQFYRNNPIEVFTKYTTESPKKLQSTSPIATSSAGNTTGRTQTEIPKIQVDLSKTSSNNDEYKGFTSSLNELLAAVKSLQQKGININPVNAISQGFFESIGKEISSNFVKPLVGSFSDRIKKDNNIDLKNWGSIGAEYVHKTWISKENPKNMQTQYNPFANHPGAKTSPALSAGTMFASSNTEIKQPEYASQNIQNFDKAVSQGVQKRFKTIINSAIAKINTEVNNEKTSSTGDIETAKKQFDKIKKGFGDAYKSLKKSLEEGNHELADTYYKMILSMGEKAKKDIDRIKNDFKKSGIESHFGSELATYSGSTKGIIQSRYINPTKRKEQNIAQLSEVTKTRTIATDTGHQVIEGIKQGLKNKGAEKEAATVALGILVEMRKILGIQSPSTRARQIGSFFIQGLTGGLSAGKKAVTDVMADLLNSALPTAQNIRNKAKKIVPNLIPDTAEERKEKEKQLENTVPDPLGIKAIKQAILNPSQNWKPGMELGDDPGSIGFFERIFTKIANKAISLSEKEYGKENGASIAKQAGAAAVLTAYPGVAMKAMMAPLALPLLPTVMAYKEAVQILTPLVNRLNQALTEVVPTQIKLSNLAGSAAGGERELDYVRDISNKYGTNIKGGAEAYSSISFATKGTRLEGEETKRIFEGIASATKFVGANASEASLIFSAFNQMVAKGKVSMEELRLQLSEKFPPAMTVFAKALGVSVPELTDLIGKGAVLAEDVLPKVATILLKDFSQSATSAANSFVLATTRMQNVGFEFSRKLVNSFAGIETGVINIGAGIAEKFLDNFEFIKKGFNVLAISLIATAAAGFQTILSTKSLAPKLAVVQNLFVATFRKTFSLMTPMTLGIFADLIDDVFGAKNSVFDNMSKGVTNAFVGAFGQLDNLTREFKGKGLFDVNIDSKEIGAFDQLKESVSGFFRIIPSGVVEMGALVLMFQQVALLAKAYVVPSLVNVGSALGEMAKGVSNAVLNLGNIKDTLADLFPTIAAGAKSAMGAILQLGLNVGAALAVMSLAQSDFADPLSGSINKAKERINTDLQGIDKALEKLKDTAKTTGDTIGKSLKDAIALPSKGLELNIGKILGIDDRSFKTDDLFKMDNEGKLGIFSSQRPDPKATEYKQKADQLGIGDFFSGEEKNFTLSQKQLLNKAEDLTKLSQGLAPALSKRNLSVDTVQNFVSGDIENAVKEVRKIDAEIEKLGQRRSGLSLINDTESKKKVREIDAEIRGLTDKRRTKIKPLSEQLGFVDDIQATLADISDQIDRDPTLPRSAKNALKNIYEPQKEAVEKTIKYLKDQGIYKITEPLEEIWTGLISKLRDADKIFEKLTNKQKIGNLQTQTNILASGSTEGTIKDSLERLSIADLQQQREAQQRILRIRENSLARLLTIPEVENTESRKKEIEDLRKSVETDSFNLADTQQKIAQAQFNLNERIKEQAESVRDYYENIAQQAVENQKEFQKVQNQIKAESQQSKIRNILADGFDTAISQFLDSISTIISKEVEGTNRQLDAQGQIYQNQIGLRNQIRSGEKLSRSLPGNPIDIKPNNGAINELFLQLKDVEKSLTNDQKNVETKLIDLKSYSKPITKSSQPVAPSTPSEPTSFIDQILGKAFGLNKEIGSRFNTGLESLAKEIYTKAKNIFNEGVKNPNPGSPELEEFISSLGQQFNNFNDAINNGLNQLQTNLAEGITVLNTVFNNLGGATNKALEYLKESVYTGVIALGTSFNNLDDTINSTLGSVGESLYAGYIMLGTSFNNLDDAINYSLGILGDNLVSSAEKFKKYMNYDTFVQGLKDLSSSISAGITNFSRNFEQSFQNFAQFDKYDDTVKVLKDFSRNFEQSFQNFAQFDKYDDTVKVLKDFSNGVINQISELNSKAIEGFTKLSDYDTVVESLRNFSNNISTGLSDFKDDIGQGLTEGYNNLKNNLVTGAENLSIVIKEFASNFTTRTSEAISNFQSNLNQQISNFGVNISNSIANFSNNFQNFTVNLGQQLQNFKNGTINQLIIFQENLVRGFNDFGSSLQQNTNNLINNINIWAINFKENFQLGLSQIGEALSLGLTKFVEDVKRLGSSLTKAIFDTTTEENTSGGLLGKIGQIGVKIGEKIGETFMGQSTVNTGQYTARDSSTGQVIKNFEQVSIHHPRSRGASGREAGRDYSHIDGKLEEVSRSRIGDLIKKDMVLYQGNNKHVPVPSPVTGIVKNTGLGVGAVTIVDEVGNLVAKILHLVNIKVKAGDRVQYGQPLGTQGGAGDKRTYPVHLHGVMTKSVWRKYLEDINDGVFDATKEVVFTGLQKQNSIVQYSKKQTEVAPKSVVTYENGRRDINTPGIVRKFSGEASFYRESKYDPLAPNLRTANGDWYNENGMTAAVPAKGSIPLNSIIRVTNARTGKSIIVRANDTGGFGNKKYNNRVIDLSKGAAEAIGITAKQGVGQIVGEVLEGKAPKGKAGDALIAKLNAAERNGKLPYTTSIPAIGKTTQAQISPVLYNTAFSQPSGNILQEKIADANKIAQQNAALAEQRIKEQEKLQQQRESEESKRELNRAINTLDKYARDLGVDFRQTAKTSRDTDFAAIPFPTQEQKYSKERRDITDEFADKRVQLEEKLTTITPAIKQARDALQQLELQPEARAALTKALNELLDKESKYQAVLKKTGEQERLTLAAHDSRYRHELDMRQKRETLETRSKAIENLRSEVEYLEIIKNTKPFDRSVKELPSLKAKIALLENEIQFEQNLNNLQQQRTEQTISPNAFQSQLKYLQQINEAKIDNINLTQQQEERELKLQEARAKVEEESKIAGLQNQLDKTQTFNADIVYRSAINEATMQRDGAIMDLKPTLDPINMFRERQKLSAIYQRDVNKADIDRQQQRISIEQSMYDLFAQPGINRRNAKTEQMSNNRANEFSINALKRETAVIEENYRYRQQVMEVEAKIAQYRLEGAQIDENQVTQLRENLAAINEFNLESINNQFKTFGRTIDDIAKESFRGLGNQIADLITQGGSLGDIFQNVFNQIANSFISNGLNNLIGGGLDTLFGRKKAKANEGQNGGLLGGLLDAIGGGSGTGLLSGIGRVLGFKTGGMVPSYVSGGQARFTDTPIGEALRREGSNSVVATLTPGERVLTIDEAVLYNTLFPQGIKNKIRPMRFNEGGMVPTGINTNILSGSQNNANINVNASIGEKTGDLNEKQLADLIRRVVAAEIRRQKSPGGIL